MGAAEGDDVSGVWGGPVMAVVGEHWAFAAAEDETAFQACAGTGEVEVARALGRGREAGQRGSEAW